ncbi:MAG: hypothetical protein ACHQU1_13110, partial [Gemmatimonadales bacterium]
MKTRELVPTRATALRAAIFALLLAGCGTDLTLPPATAPITNQQINLFALTNTPVNTNSAYDMLQLFEVRVDQNNSFDFAFDLRFDSAYGIGKPGDTVAVLIPRGALGFVADPGLIYLPGIFNFDSLQVAPTGGYVKDKAVQIHEGDVLFAASRIQTCNFGFTLPHYAKLIIQKIDLAAFSTTIRVVIDPNCGYREINSGIPT